MTTVLYQNIVGRWMYMELDKVDSTSLFLKSEVEAGSLDLAAVRAVVQTCGRGRLKRTWESPEGGLYLTVSLDVQARRSPLATYTMSAGLALCDVLRDMGLEPGLKWPNDVLVRGKKISGMLSESAVGPKGWRLLVGVGVNVNVTPCTAEARYRVTSVACETGREADLRNMSFAFLKRLEHWIGVLESSLGKAKVWDAWKEASCTLGRNVAVDTGAGIVRGIAADIDADFGLLIDTKQGRAKVHVGDCLHLEAKT